uniref:hypothetical protein n=1 Tax=Candidatus Electronema sp. TaxID=2698783 RepID=UPI00405761D4
MENDEKLKRIMQVCSFLVLLLGSTLFGSFGKTAEMGLAIVAGCLSLAFANLDKIAKFKGAGFEAEMRDKVEDIQGKVDTITAKETEPSGLAIRAYSLNDDSTKQVLKCLGDSKYTWRSLSGISNDAKLSMDNVQKSLNWLNSNGLAIQLGLARQDRQENWGLTEEGWGLYYSIFPSKVDQ